MKKGEQTKRKMIDATASLLQARGYSGTGLNDVLEQSGAPKGSLYFHFPGGKEELAAAAVRSAGQQWQGNVLALLEAAPDMGEGAQAVCRLIAQSLEETGFENGCPVATVALESAPRSDVLHAACSDVYGAWQAIIEERLLAAGLPRGRAERSATATLAMVEGAMLLSKAYRSTEPLRRVGEELAESFALLAHR